MLSVATFNVNSLRQRIGHLLDWLRETNVDIACLQEIKTLDEGFPGLRSRRWATMSKPTAKRLSTASRSSQNSASTR